MSQAFTPRLFDNLSISWDLRRLFAVYFIISCQLLLKNSKQKTTKHGQLSLIGCQLRHHVTNCDMFKILHKINQFEPIRYPDNCDVRVIFLWRYLSWPRNYYNDNKSLNPFCWFSFSKILLRECYYFYDTTNKNNCQLFVPPKERGRLFLEFDISHRNFSIKTCNLIFCWHTNIIHIPEDFQNWHFSFY